MKHYYCEVCNGVDTIPHACHTDGCPNYGQLLTEHDGDDTEAHHAAHEKWLQENQPQTP